MFKHPVISSISFGARDNTTLGNAGVFHTLVELFTWPGLLDVFIKNLDTKALKKKDNEMSRFGMVLRNDLFFKNSVSNGQVIDRCLIHISPWLCLKSPKGF